MKSFSRVIKWGLVLAPVGGFAYLNSTHSLKTVAHTQAPQEPGLSGYFKQYIEHHNLVSPHLYKKFQQNYKFNHFFEKGVLQELEGLDAYDLFLCKQYHDKLTEKIKVTQEEKEKLHENAKLHCTFTANSKLQGRTGHVHGGFTFTLFDNIAGCLAFMACDFSPAVTAYLNVSHENPMDIGAEYIAVVEVAKVEGRKVFLKGKIIDQDNKIYTNMESLFVKPKWANIYLQKLYKSLLA